MTIAEDYELDAMFLDRENLPVAWIEVKARPLGEEWKPLLMSLMGQRPHRTTEFILAIDPVCIQLYRPTETELGEPLARLETPKILSHYEPNFTGKRIYEPYLQTLVEAWLRDLAYHWKSPNPPGMEELKATGLLERVAGGTTQNSL